MKRSSLGRLLSLVIAGTLVSVPLTIGCGGGEADPPAPMEVEDDAETEMDDTDTTEEP